MAYDEIELVRETLEKERQTVVEVFKDPFQAMTAMAQLAGLDEGLTIPVLCEADAPA